MSTIKIDHSAFIRNLVITKRLTNYNANIILIQAGSLIKIGDPEDYKKTDL